MKNRQGEKKGIIKTNHNCGIKSHKRKAQRPEELVLRASSLQGQISGEKGGKPSEDLSGKKGGSLKREEKEANVTNKHTYKVPRTRRQQPELGMRVGAEKKKNKSNDSKAGQHEKFMKKKKNGKKAQKMKKNTGLTLERGLEETIPRPGGMGSVGLNVGAMDGTPSSPPWKKGEERSERKRSEKTVFDDETIQLNWKKKPKKWGWEPSHVEKHHVNAAKKKNLHLPNPQNPWSKAKVVKLKLTIKKTNRHNGVVTPSWPAVRGGL